MEQGKQPQASAGEILQALRQMDDAALLTAMEAAVTALGGNAAQQTKLRQNFGAVRKRLRYAGEKDLQAWLNRMDPAQVQAILDQYTHSK